MRSKKRNPLDNEYRCCMMVQPCLTDNAHNQKSVLSRSNGVADGGTFDALPRFRRFGATAPTLLAPLRRFLGGVLTGEGGAGVGDATDGEDADRNEIAGARVGAGAMTGSAEDNDVGASAGLSSSSSSTSKSSSD
jgi:hypothetical protein